jgi:hypothetical protein
VSKAYLNALYEEGTRKELFEWVCKLDGECDQLRADKRRLDEENAKLRRTVDRLIVPDYGQHRPEEEIGVSFN